MCRYDFEKNHAINLRVNGSTFMGRITGSNAYFIGNVRGNIIHIYDREDKCHLNYRISACIVDHQVSNGGCPCSSATGAENATDHGDCPSAAYGDSSIPMRMDTHSENKVREK